MRKTAYKTDIIHLEVELFEGCVFLHFTTKCWSKTIYKECLDLLRNLLEYLKSVGVRDVFAIVPLTNIKLHKFAMLFGFDILVFCDEKEIYLMYQEI